jgi:hypothetical protein
MEVKVNGKVISHGHDDCRNEEFCLGLISFKLSPGSYYLETKLTDTPVRKTGNYLTVAGFVAIIWLLIKKNAKNTK